MKNLFILFTILIIFTSCKEVPTFQNENIYDPESSSYILGSPSNLTLNTYSSYTAVSWSKLPSKYITGYLLFRSHIDSLHYEEIANVPHTRNYFNDQEAGNPINIYYKLRAYFVQDSDTIFSEPIYSKINRKLVGINEAILTANKTIQFYIESSFTETTDITIEQKIGSGEFSYLTTVKAKPWTQTTYTYSELPIEEITYRAFVENSYEKTPYFMSKAYADLKTIPRPLEVLQSTVNSAEIKFDNISDVDEIILYKNVYTAWGLNLDREFVARFPSSQTSIVIEGLSQEHSNQFFIHAKKGAFFSTSYFPLTLSNYDGSSWAFSTESFN